MGGKTVSQESSTSRSLPTLESQRVEATRVDNISSKVHASKYFSEVIGNKCDRKGASYSRSRKIHDNLYEKRDEVMQVHANHRKEISSLRERPDELDRELEVIETFKDDVTDTRSNEGHVSNEEGLEGGIRLEDLTSYYFEPLCYTEDKGSQKLLEQRRLDPYFIRELGIESINVARLERLFQVYFSGPLPPTEKMFPWLHGLHDDNFSQRLFFQNNSRKDRLPNEHEQYKPDARFLMCVTPGLSCDQPDMIFKNTVQDKEILHPIDISKAEVLSVIDNIITVLFPQELDLVKDRLKRVLSMDCFKINCLPIFLNLDPPKGISLRNFHIQVAKLATCADFVTYCICESHLRDECLCRSTARVLWLAQKYHASRENIALGKYKVYLFMDSSFIFRLLRNEISYEKHHNFLTFKEKDLDDDILLDENKGFDISSLKCLESWDSNYKLKEKLETLLMSSATSIGGNVWAGNSWDSHIMLVYLLKFLGQTEIKSATNEEENGVYYTPHNSLVSLDAERYGKINSFLSRPKANWRLLIHCQGDATLPDMNTLSSLLKLYSGKSKDIKDCVYNYIEFYQSGSVRIGDCRPETLMIILNTCKLIYLASQNNSDPEFIWSTLIYCSDGYTELSLLIFCYLIYSRNIFLEAAIIQLHSKYRRPFYLFESDVSFLRKLEVILMKHSPLTKKVVWDEPEEIDTSELSHLLYKDLGFNLEYCSDDGFSESEVATSESTTESESSSEEDYKGVFSGDWVKSVEGTLPSLILPYLYLGSLKHANSLALLSKLGISKIVSVGEDLAWLNSYSFRRRYHVHVGAINSGGLEIYNISRSNHNVAPCCVSTIIKVNNLLDDGINGLSSSLKDVLEYFDSEYFSSNGRTKFLVHCRVGVSRSATVVIAEVMKRLQISLPKAYLYVRVRRLNIIIQPNLRFMYELFKWEEQERKKISETRDQYNQERPAILREIDWFVMCREILCLNLAYMIK